MEPTRPELERFFFLDDADKARHSPLKDKHLNVLGRYAIIPSQPAQGLRPLRDPASVDEVDRLTAPEHDSETR